jgi:hypothetical protein
MQRNVSSLPARIFGSSDVSFYLPFLAGFGSDSDSCYDCAMRCCADVGAVVVSCCLRGCCCVLAVVRHGLYPYER